MPLKIISSFRDPDTDPLFEYIREKYSDVPITLFYERFPSSEEELKINPYNFLMILEPNEFFGLHNLAVTNQNLFAGIITWSNLVWENCYNAIKFTFNGRVLDDEFIDESILKTKEFEVSYLCGDKKMTEGHFLRHKVYDLRDQIIIPKKWFYVLDDYDTTNKVRPGYSTYSKDLSHIPKNIDPIGFGKRVLFDTSMFNVVIENVKHLNWYNKIGDNFLSKTVPIYWGCSNIEDFGYDKRGIIYFDTPEELLNILNNLTPDTYHQMKPYIDFNYEIAKQDDLNNRIGEIFNSFLELNNI
jgi:hypothetical protein